jgi:hypothetical protein
MVKKLIMKDFDPQSAVSKGAAAQISALLDFNPSAPDLWGNEDLHGMFKQRLAASIKNDLGTLSMRSAMAAAYQSGLREASRSGIASFYDLFTHPHPPILLLRLSKDVFKGFAGKADERRPEQQVAYLMYILSILTATGLGHSISSLTSAQLLTATQWALNQSWIDSPGRDLFKAASQYLIKAP